MKAKLGNNFELYTARNITQINPFLTDNCYFDYDVNVIQKSPVIIAERTLNVSCILIQGRN